MGSIRGRKEMGKSARKRTKKTIQIKKAEGSKRTDKGQTKAAEYVSCLLELHKLQGGLLNQLDKEIK
jgi:hypothetical protein